MFKTNLKEQTYECTLNWGTLRFGDFIGLTNICAGFKELYGSELKLAVDKKKTYGNAQHSFNLCKDYIINDTKNKQHLPYTGNIWAYNDYIYRFLDVSAKIKNKYLDQFDNMKAVVNPIFDAPYNRDRNWSNELFTNIIGDLIGEGYKVSVIGVQREIEPRLGVYKDQVKCVYDNFEESVKEISTAKVVVSGDTGFSHLIGILDAPEQKMIFIYGDSSYKRHTTDRREDVEKFTNNSLLMNNYKDYIYVDFTPKCLLNKEKLIFTQNNYTSHNVRTFITKGLDLTFLLGNAYDSSYDKYIENDENTKILNMTSDVNLFQCLSEHKYNMLTFTTDPRFLSVVRDIRYGIFQKIENESKIMCGNPTLFLPYLRRQKFDKIFIDSNTDSTLIKPLNIENIVRI